MKSNTTSIRVFRKKPLFSSLILLFCLISFGNFAQKCQHSSEVRTLYKQLEANGFDTKEPINYQYFFLDDNQQDLTKLKDILTQKGFSFVNFSKNNGKNQLQIERKEAHNAESMLAKGKELSQLAKTNNVETFDGFEIRGDDEEDLSSSFENEVEKIPVNQLFKKGIDFYETHEDTKALAVFDRCIKLGINTETAYFKRGNCKTALGKPEEAIADLEKVLKINPNHFEANFNLGGLHLDKGNYEKAVNFYKKAVLLNPKSDNGFYRLAEAFQQLGQKEAALQNCQKSLQINPDNAFAKELLLKLK